MINKYAEIQKRAVLYKAAQGIYRIKTALSWKDNYIRWDEPRTTYGTHSVFPEYTLRRGNSYSMSPNTTSYLAGLYYPEFADARDAAVARMVSPHDAAAVTASPNSTLAELKFTEDSTRDVRRLKQLNRLGNRQFADAPMYKGTHTVMPNFNSSFSNRFFDLAQGHKLTNAKGKPIPTGPDEATAFYNRIQRIRKAFNEQVYKQLGSNIELALSGNAGNSAFLALNPGDTAPSQAGKARLTSIINDIRSGNVAKHKDLLDSTFGFGVGDKIQRMYNRMNKADPSLIKWQQAVDRIVPGLQSGYDEAATNRQIQLDNAAREARRQQIAQEQAVKAQAEQAAKAQAEQAVKETTATKPTTTNTSKSTSASGSTTKAPSTGGSAGKGATNAAMHNKWLLPAALIAAPLAAAGGYYLYNRNRNGNTRPATLGVGAFGQAALDRFAQ